jgi:hypothetical protein
MEPSALENDEFRSLNETIGSPPVLPNQPTGWAAMAENMRAYDEDRVKDVKEDIDSLFIFVRLSCTLSQVFLTIVCIVGPILCDSKRICRGVLPETLSAYALPDVRNHATYIIAAGLIQYANRNNQLDVSTSLRYAYDRNYRPAVPAVVN